MYIISLLLFFVSEVSLGQPIKGQPIKEEKISPAVKEEELLKEGKELIKRKDYRGAQEIFTQLVKNFPQSLMIDYYHMQLAESLYYQEKYNEAQVQYQRVKQITQKERYKEYADYAIAWCFFQFENFKDAIFYFQEFLKNYPASKYKESAQEALKQAQQMQRNKEAHEIYQRAWNLYNTKKSTKDLEDAFLLLDEIIKNYKDTPYFPSAKSLSERISLELAELQQKEKIIEEKEKIIEEKKIQEEKVLFREIEPKPDDIYQRVAYTYYILAKSYYELGYYKECLDRLELICQYYKDTPYAKEAELIIERLKLQRERQKAVDIFEEALRSYEKGDYHNALSLFKRVQEEYKDTTYADLASQYIRLIKNRAYEEEAAKIWEEAKILKEKQNYKGALEKLDEILRNYPQSFWIPYVLLSKGEILYFHKKDYKEASLAFQRIANEYPKSEIAPQALYYLADCFEKTGKYQEAKTAYQRLLASYPDSLFASPEYKKFIESKIEELGE